MIKKAPLPRFYLKSNPKVSYFFSWVVEQLLNKVFFIPTFGESLKLHFFRKQNNSRPQSQGARCFQLPMQANEQKKWEADIAETQGHEVNFPMVADADSKVANLYGMIHPNADNTMTVRTVFIIDPNKKIRLMLTYPASTGRNFEEVLRVIDSMQLTDKHKVATPVNWKDGDDVIILPSLSKEDAQKRFPEGWDEKKPYLRVVPQPS